MNTLSWQLGLVAKVEDFQSQGWLAYYFSSSGWIFGLLIPLVGLALSLVGILLLCTVKSRWPFVLLLLAAFLPLPIGIVGTALGLVRAFHMIAAVDGPPSAERYAASTQAAMLTTYSGAVCSVPPLLLAIAGLALKGKRRQ